MRCQFSSDIFHDSILPCSMRIIKEINSGLKNRVIYSDESRLYNIIDNEMETLAEKLLSLQITREIVVQAFILAAIRAFSDNSDGYEDLDNESNIATKNEVSDRIQPDNNQEVFNFSNIKQLANKSKLDTILVASDSQEKVLILSCCGLILVSTGFMDIASWLDLASDLSSLLDKRGLISFINWLCDTKLDLLKWSLNNPHIPYNSKNCIQQTNNERISEMSEEFPLPSSATLSPATAAQRQLSHAKSVGLLISLGRRLLSYGCYDTCGKIRSIIFTCLPCNQAGICRKTLSIRPYKIPSGGRLMKNLMEYTLCFTPHNTSSTSLTSKNLSPEKEDGEMPIDKYDNGTQSNLETYFDDYQHLLYPWTSLKVFQALLNCDKFLETPFEYLSLNSEDFTLLKDFEILLSYFEDNAPVYVPEYNGDFDTHMLRLPKISKTNSLHYVQAVMECIPSSLDSWSFRFNFVYRLVFLYCNIMALEKREYQVLFKITKTFNNSFKLLVQRFVGYLDHITRMNKFSSTIFFQYMLLYELLWVTWKISSCTDIKRTINTGNTGISPQGKPKKRKVEIANILHGDIPNNGKKVTKTVDSDTFTSYISYITSKEDKKCTLISNSVEETTCRVSELRRGKSFSNPHELITPKFTSERDLLYLSCLPYSDEVYVQMSIEKRLEIKLKDYIEKVNIDKDPINGIEESEKSIYETFFKWRYNRLIQRCNHSLYKNLDLYNLAINDLDKITDNSSITKTSNDEIKRDIKIKELELFVLQLFSEEVLAKSNTINNINVNCYNETSESSHLEDSNLKH
ncbi:hypothetical protein cand_032130 [Cryptosporidium andersoni]|uniref:Uncharacterized protein n=1 Tax=Cryptosporidium andersoni TaxID=117008 RepID=A0A1J4MEQ0_9CRYT|nr:hypothetical protein cand_032130 [Cryptosporidium andersoni]